MINTLSPTLHHRNYGQSLGRVILILMLISLAILNSSCDRRIAKIFINRPDNEFDSSLEETSVEFNQGWNHGCETGMGSGSNTFYKLFYKNNVVDGYRFAASSDYKTAWGNAFWYCYRHDYIKHKGGLWGSAFGGYK